ncbi:MAG: gliding motility-associated C-terminal domain-containing protein [Bacteroidetes bacterium]|nr:gliding motility-associated C-terminal domain-containing protein [Bacteroidota bacterium]
MKYKFTKSALFSFALLVLCSFGFAQTCPYSLGNDTAICQGVPINFSLIVPAAATGFTQTYLWDNSTTTATRNVNAYGNYYCKVTRKGTNKVTNGNFSSGNNGFTSGYIVGTGGSFGPISAAGTYLVTTNASIAHTNFPSFGNHTTTGTGNMMVVNGSQNPNTSVWCQTIPVTPNLNYNFSTWVATCKGTLTAELAVLQFSINGVPLFLNGSTTQNTFTPPPQPLPASSNLPAPWALFAATWNSGANTSASICIVNQNTTGSGNDFALDDIFFQEVCEYTDTLKVTPKPFPTGYNAGLDAVICSGQTANLNANNGDGSAFSWSSVPPGFSSSTLNNTVNPTDTTAYIFTSELNGCKKSDTATVYVGATPVPSAGTDDAICEGQSYTLNGNPGGAAVFGWTSLPAGFTSNQATPQVSPLVTTEFILTASNGNCVATASVKIDVNTSPVADFTVAPLDSSCNSYSLSFTNNSTNSLSYFWDFGDGELSSDVTPIHTYTSQNIFNLQLTAKNTGCSDTKILPLKIAFSENSLFVPNSFTPNNDLKNDTFYIPKGCLKSAVVSIYDRWGQLAKRWDTLSGNWDGKVGGFPAPEGVYVYTIDGFFLSGERARKKGTITLYR